ncbi:apolipoprotein N-acyltransferase [uncultured Tateyamaria sp.]|uniref:apolipoprotein N-acyltransferase n=1 Tax=uncultured Tateyamaria sp. TaxID=455651 RepID=UPI00262D2AF6|nr:apolipoprotein N-acyltransferase [uncultured Tateyamaria sp.]
MINPATRMAGWPTWAHLLLAITAGAVGSMAHAPLSVGVLILVPLLAGFALLRGAQNVRGALIRGWALGFGYFAPTLSWITEPFQVDAAVTGWMAPFALVLLALLLGSFWAFALAFARWAGGQAWVLVFAWAGVEMLRAYVFTGFPWAAPPQALVDGLAGQGLAWGGPHGVMLAMAALAAVIASRTWKALRIAVAAACVSLFVLPVMAPKAELTAHTVRLVQPNAPQDEKWDPSRVPVFVNRQIDFTAAGPVPDLVVWPETALPYLVENAQVVFDAITEAARGAPVVLGIQRRQFSDYFNSLVVLDAAGQVTQTYDKHHLVPFGEYMPFEWFFRHIEVGGLAARAEGGYAAGPGARLLDFGALGRALPLICYEAVFAHDVGGAPERPTFLMQLTNDAWFGARSGPQQHLAQARMRAIEQGLPMIRAANTGISAVIDPNGRVTAALGLNMAGYLDAVLPAPAPPTIYSRTGDAPWAVLLFLGLVAAVLTRARLRQSGGIDAGEPHA